MPKFRVTLAQKVWEHATVEIEAADEDIAYDNAISDEVLSKIEGWTYLKEVDNGDVEVLGVEKI
jgi:hypothetical protein